MSKYAEIIEKIDENMISNEELTDTPNRGSSKLPHHKCTRCKNDLGPIEQWFNYGIKLVKCGYTMLPEPLCQSCFHELETFLKGYEVKNE